MKLFIQLFILFSIFIFKSSTVYAQGEHQNEISKFIAAELEVKMMVTNYGKGYLMFDYEDNSYSVYSNSRYLQLTTGSGFKDPILLLEMHSNSKLEKKVIQSFKEILNEVNKNYYLTKAYWNNYDDPIYQLHPIFSMSLDMKDNETWKAEFKNAVEATKNSLNLFKEKYVTSMSKMIWDIYKNETDPEVIREALFWAKDIHELQPDIDRTYLHACLLSKSGQTLLALDKIDEVIERCKQEKVNYDLSTALKNELLAIVYTDDVWLYNMKVENQEWQVYNLRTTTFKNGDKILHAQTAQEWKEAGEKGIPAYCYYNHNNKFGFKLGKLYNWYAVNDSRGLAPKGWHIPSEDEWNVLVTYFGKDKLGGYLKSKNNWANDYGTSGNGDNYQHFDALPGGWVSEDGEFSYLGEYGKWWSTTVDDEGLAVSITFSDNSSDVYLPSAKKAKGYSVRCIKD
ncbi:hypothetical protein A9Q86_15855 [Flavobacteriales bacterium 33_180_T64]|nr:hypothetical protein A9Q86_15855 [Flavobacteriales bacterium 33_180_T64]